MIGQLIAERYRIDAQIGVGGMGIVYKGFDTSTRDVVAIKHLKPGLATPTLLERFKREGESLRELNHPNIVKMLEAVTYAEQHFLVIEYLAGGDLAQLMQKGEILAIETVLKYAIDIADALTRAHHLNIIHRDLKPANVLIAADGTPRLADFGIAHLGSKERVTDRSALVGTMDYLAPETFAGNPIDNRSDIWSFGILLFEMLTGKRPFTGKSASDIIMGIMNQDVPDIEERRPDVPVALADVVYRMLHKNPVQRIPSVRFVGAELEVILRGDHATPVTPHRFATPVPINLTPTLHNLPMNLTKFIGRKTEITDISQLLGEDNVRLVTLVAQGGMGKSRLAVEVARQNIETFADGVYLVELAPLNDPESIVQAIIDAIRCPFLPDKNRTRLQQLVDYLDDKHMLLLLDNYEHLLDGASIVTDILNATSQTKILVTSRQRLHESNEHPVELKAMSYPAWETLEDAMAYDASQLFVQSARRIQADFELTSDNLGYITRICQVVQGLPLGIVLAASWLQMLSPAEIVTEMKKDFDFLESDFVDLPERQRSMRQVFDYSWQLMTEKEQEILIALSVFRGGFARDAATAVCQASLRDLMGLMNKSLIQRDTESGRYSIHELLRQYAAEKLQQSTRETVIQETHKVYFAKWMQTREGELTFKRQQAALDDIEIDFGNVRVAWERSIQQQDYENLNLMLEALHLFTEMRIRHKEGYKMLGDAIKVTPESETLYYRALIRQARLSQQGSIGSLEDRRPKLEKAQQLAEANNDTGEQAFGLFVDATSRQETYAGYEMHRRVFELMPEDNFYRSHVMVWLSIEQHGDLNFEERIQLVKDAIELQRARGDVNELAWTYSNLIGRLIEAGRLAEADQYTDDALNFCRLIRHPHAESLTLLQLSTIPLAAGELEKVIEIANRSYQLAVQGNSSIIKMWSIAIKLDAQIHLNVSITETVTLFYEILNEAKKNHDYAQTFIENSITGLCIYLVEGKHAQLRQLWHSSSFPSYFLAKLRLLAVELVHHYRLSEDDFAPVIIGHLSKYGDDTVGWLHRWQLYQDAVSALQLRIDETTYREAYQHGQSLSLEEMLETLKEQTGHPDYQ